MPWPDRAFRATVALALDVAWMGLGAATALAASPSPTPAPAGDPRSPGQGPGLVGDPLFALGVVIALAALTVLATLAWVRLTGGARPVGPHDGTGS